MIQCKEKCVLYVNGNPDLYYILKVHICGNYSWTGDSQLYLMVLHHNPNSTSTWKQWTNSHSVEVPLKITKLLFIYLFSYLHKNVTCK